MFIATVPNRNSPPCLLLRVSFRENGKVKTRTIANVTKWDPAILEGFRTVLKNKGGLEGKDGAFEITRTLPYGHASAVLGTIKNIGLDRVLYSRKTKERDLALAMIVSRMITPQSKLATARALSSDTASSAITNLLDMEQFRPEDLYQAMDWLHQSQSRIEKALAKKHLKDGTLILYDLTSTYFEGRHCPLAKIGYSRDGKKGTLQITVGLLCNADGCPIAVEVFEGNTTDSQTVKSQLEKLKSKFGLSRMVFVGDRGIDLFIKFATFLKNYVEMLRLMFMI